MEEAQKTTSCVIYADMAYQTKANLVIDKTTMDITNNKAALAMLRREYRHLTSTRKRGQLLSCGRRLLVFRPHPFTNYLLPATTLVSSIQSATHESSAKLCLTTLPPMRGIAAPVPYPFRAGKCACLVLFLFLGQLTVSLSQTTAKLPYQEVPQQK
jgi:hypothetical protein